MYIYICVCILVAIHVRTGAGNLKQCQAAVADVKLKTLILFEI